MYLKQWQLLIKLRKKTEVELFNLDDHEKFRYYTSPDIFRLLDLSSSAPLQNEEMFESLFGVDSTSPFHKNAVRPAVLVLYF
jgi:hypothetical protein